MTTRSTPGGLDRGATLVELLVVLLLLSVMVLVGAQLVTHAVRVLGSTAQSVRNPITVVATERLRRDVQEAGIVEEPSAVWTRSPLELRPRSGGVLRWSVVDGDLVRTTLGRTGSLLDSRVVLRGVTRWQWRSPSPGIVDVAYGRLLAPPPEQLAPTGSGGSRDRPGEAGQHTEFLRFAVRGSGGGLWW
jgi:hypothetical protein